MCYLTCCPHAKPDPKLLNPPTPESDRVQAAAADSASVSEQNVPSRPGFPMGVTQQLIFEERLLAVRDR